MDGRDPSVPEPDSELPTRKFKITFVDDQNHEHVVEVDPDRIPYDTHGRPGSLLEIALGHGVAIDHACGGLCACSTCHVIVREGLDACSPPTDEEEDRLDEAYGVTSSSRLACQCIPNGTQDLVVHIPSWNRNLAREGH